MIAMVVAFRATGEHLRFVFVCSGNIDVVMCEFTVSVAENVALLLPGQMVFIIQCCVGMRNCVGSRTIAICRMLR